MPWPRRRRPLPSRPIALTGEYLVPDDALEGELAALTPVDDTVVALSAATVRLSEEVERLQEELVEARRRNQDLARQIARLSIDLRAELSRLAGDRRVTG